MEGNKILYPGFTAIAHWLAVKDDFFYPEDYIFFQNEVKKVVVASINYEAAETCSPGNISESELIEMMESK